MNVLGAVAKGLGDVVLGSGPEDEVTEAVEALLERIATGFIPEDRAMATAKLKELVTESPGSRAAFGQMAFPVIREVVIEDGTDVEAVRGVLELLHLCIKVDGDALAALSAAGETEGGESPEASTGAMELDRAALVVADLFCREDENLDLPFGLLSTNQPVSDFYTRYSALKCINSLLVIHAHRVQQHVLGSPTAVAKLMDLLSSEESMEVERNESLLLLVGLCKGNLEIQKLVVFEGAFDHLFTIIDKEERGGVIVQDCLELLVHLITQNSSNQLMFRESGHLAKLVSLIPLPSQGDGSAQHSPTDIPEPRVLFLALEVLNVLLRAPSCTSKTDLKATQDQLARLQLLQGLARLACAENTDGDGNFSALWGQSFRTLACLLKENSRAKDEFPAMTVRWTRESYEDVPVLHCILLRTLHSKSAFERDAALEVIRTFCEGNETGQAMLASTVHVVEGSDFDGSGASLGTFGTTLLKAIDGPTSDDVSKHQAALVMGALLDGCALAKDRADATILAKFVRILSDIKGEASQAQSSTVLLGRAVLKLLCLWLNESPGSVQKVFSSPSHVPLLVDLIVKEDCKDVVTRGLASVVLGICVLQKVEARTDASFYTSSSVLDIVSKHIGLHTFFCAWEDMAATREYKRGLHPLRTARVITKKEVDACLGLEGAGETSAAVGITRDFFGFHLIFSPTFADCVKSLHPLVRLGVVSSYSGPNQGGQGGQGGAEEADGSAMAADAGLVRKLQDEIKQLRSRNESLATDLLAMTSGTKAIAPAPAPQNGTSGENQGPEGPSPGAEPPKDQVAKEELMAAKAKQAELDIALRESDKRVDALEAQVRSAASKLKEEEGKREATQEESAKHENDLKMLSEAYNTLEEHSFNLESKIKDLETNLEEASKNQPAGGSADAAQAAAQAEARIQSLEADLTAANGACSDLRASQDAAVKESEGLRARVARLEESLQEERTRSAALASGASEEAVAAMRAEVLSSAKAEREAALSSKDQEHAMEMASLRDQLQMSQAQYKEAQGLYEAKKDKAHTEEELKRAVENARNEAAADTDEEIYQLETKLRDMQTKLLQAQRQGEGSKDMVSGADLEAAVAAAREEAMAEADESMNDLLVCLGQEEKKTEVLAAKLQELGHDVEDLLADIESEEDEDED